MSTSSEKTLDQILQKFWDLAQAICAVVESFQPDLVITLLHSGEGLLRAALAAWDETHDSPFPPVVRTNLGREKQARYGMLRGDLVGNSDSKVIDHAIEIETPFEMEYACSSRERAGAPVLVPVPDRKGACIPAQLLFTRPEFEALDIFWMLEEWGRERVREGRPSITDDPDTILKELDPVLAELACEPNFASIVGDASDPTSVFKTLPTAKADDLFAQTGLLYLLYTRLEPNLDFVLQGDLSTAEKAARLARLAVDSVTPETFHENRDGIYYLIDAIRHGVHIPLTEPYKQAILQLSGNASNLEEARRRIARQKGIQE